MTAADPEIPDSASCLRDVADTLGGGEEGNSEPAAGTTTLQWGVKVSFRQYVGAAGGSIRTTLVRMTPEGQFEFRFSETARESGAIQLRFVGALRFTAHGGLMDVLIQDPWVHLRPDGAQLSVVGTEQTRTAGGRLVIADLRPNGHSPKHQTFSTWLTTDGTVAFDFQYPAGTELSPVNVLRY